ncbi:uncharacterized protein LODBEIA_P27860 [Lodderomyces beijingensis]|uniref:PH-like domain-containing protein n=1 Tax=Lodderomyces beijingensis TaxID=1775926 RepID=A0ABP0ZK91_9ASCO
MIETGDQEHVLEKLLASTKATNAELVEILSTVRSLKLRDASATSSLSSIARGIHTRNNKLLVFIDQSLRDFDFNDHECFKNFVNHFLLWFDNDNLTLFQKYSELVTSNFSIDHASFEALAAPLKNFANFVQFIDLCPQYLRNPYIIEKLDKIKAQLCEIQTAFESHFVSSSSSSSQENSINFTNVRSFTCTSRHDDPHLVSSYFTAKQIVHRTGNSNVSSDGAKVELILVDLIGGGDYNALAVLSVDVHAGVQPVRSLLYPPFRVNELSLNYCSEFSKMVLRSINFMGNDHQSERSLNIAFEDQELYCQWVAYLSKICPLEKNRSTNGNQFLINSENSSPAMSGLGINVMSDTDHKNFMSLDVTPPGPVNEPTKQPFKELISSPTISCTRVDPVPSQRERARAESIKSSISGGKTESVFSSSSAPPPPPPQPNSKAESIKSQYEKSLPIIKKTINPYPSPDSNKTCDSEEGDEKLFHIINRRKLSDDSNGENRPISSQAEIMFATPEPSEYYSPSLVPPTSSKAVAKTQTGTYELSNGSAIDIANFGKGYQPSFSRGTTTSTTTTSNGSLTTVQKKSKKRSFFALFRKSKENPNSSAENLTELTPRESVDEPSCLSSEMEELAELVEHGSNTSKSTPIAVPQITTSRFSSESTIAKTESSIFEPKANHPLVTQEKESDTPPSCESDALENSENNQTKMTRSSSKIPSPFALPSSTSTYFFKPHLNASAPNLSSSSQPPSESKLEIPQKLKDEINSDSTEDLYISESSSKTLKISKWKSKYGKWEMLTTAELIFVKIVLDCESRRCWFMVFKEEYDDQFQEFVDVPVLILDVDPAIPTKVHSSSALDLQINSKNSVTGESMLIMIRTTSALVDEMISNMQDAISFLNPSKSTSYGSLNASKSLTSDNTLSSSMLDQNPSKSSTFTSLSSYNSSYHEKRITSSINTDEIYNSCITNNPRLTRFRVMETTIRLQKQMQSYSEIKNPSSWKKMSMYNLNIDRVFEPMTHICHYEFQLVNLDEGTQFDWLISDENKFSIIEKIGRAGLLVKVSEAEIYMLECKGKKEFKKLYDIF